MDKKSTAAKPANAAPEEKKSLTDKINEFFTKNRTAIIAAVGAILAVIVIIGAYTLISNSVAENSSRAMELARTKLEQWGQESDETKKTELESAITADLDAIIKKWPRTFAAQHALFTKAGIATANKKWEDAEKFALEAANKLPKTYLAPIALEAAAVAAEEQGKADKALEYYQKYVKTYVSDTPGLAHAYFSLGRLAEASSNWKDAIANYEKLTADFAASDWAKLAKDRLIYLKAQGLDK